MSNYKTIREYLDAECEKKSDNGTDFYICNQDGEEFVVPDIDVFNNMEYREESIDFVKDKSKPLDKVVKKEKTID